jgi:histone H3/H4
MGRVHQQKRRAVGGARLGSRTATVARRHRTSGGIGKSQPEEYLKKAEMRRLVLRAGNLRIAKDAYTEIRELYFEPLRDLMRQVMQLAVMRNGKTIKRADVDYIIKKEADGGRLPRPYGDPRL